MSTTPPSHVSGRGDANHTNAAAGKIAKKKTIRLMVANASINLTIKVLDQFTESARKIAAFSDKITEKLTRMMRVAFLPHVH